MGAVTIKWKQVCKPVEEKGLGIRSLMEFNGACMAFLAVEFLKGNKTWCSFTRTIFYKNDNAIQYYRCSSIWKGIKSGL